MVEIPKLHDDPEPTWKTEIREDLFRLKADAKKAEEEWGKRWFLSLAIGNAGGLLAMSTATLNITTGRHEPFTDSLLIAIIPSAWAFSVGLITGALVPYCWKKKVEKISAWVWVREQELEDGGPTSVWVGEEQELSSAMREQYEAHQNRWERRFIFVERISALSFLLGLFWALASFTTLAICKDL